MITDSPTLTVEDRGPVRWVMFNRPDVHNAQNAEMLRAFSDVLDQTERDAQVRVLVLGGHGPSFCSGHDLREMVDNPEYAANAATVEGRYWQETRLFTAPVEKFRHLPIPTICRIQGHCLAAGLMFAGSADLVVASEDASFGSPVIPALANNDAEVPSFAMRLGERRAKQLLWLGERMSVQRAYELNIVNWIVPNDELDRRVEKVAERLVDVPREVLALSKATFQFIADQQGERDVNTFHFVNHQLSHHTTEAVQLVRERVQRGRHGSVLSERNQLAEDYS